VEKASELFDKYAVGTAGRVSLTELQQLMREASSEFPHLREHATFLDGKLGSQRFGGLVFNAFLDANKAMGEVRAGIQEGSMFCQAQILWLDTRVAVKAMGHLQMWAC
jgi:hypothetical protein